MLNSQLKEKLRESSKSAGVEEYKARCDFAVQAFKEAIGFIDSEIEKIKESVNMEKGMEKGVEKQS